MEALHEAILPRTTRINVDRLDLVVSQPLLDGLRDELWAVVRPQMFGSAVLFDGFLEPGQYILRAQRSVSTQDMALAGVFIQDRQHPQRTAPHSRIGNEVPSPDVTAMRGLDWPPGRDAAPHNLALGRWHPLTLSAPQSLHLSFAHSPTLLTQ